MKLVIINGLPCTGKTTLGNKLSEKLKLPFYSKDAFKEIIFDKIGSKKELGKKSISEASYEMFYYVLEQNLKVNNDVIIESNFVPDFAEKIFNNFKEKYNFEIIQIFCETDGKILFERFKERSFGEDRHEGHDDKNNIETWKNIMINNDLLPLDIGGKLIRLDTTYFEKIDYNELYNLIK